MIGDGARGVLVMSLKKFALPLFLFFYLGTAVAVQIDCYEDELNPSARVLLLSSRDTSPEITAFEQIPNPSAKKDNMGFIFQKIKQSQSSEYRFPLGVYTGTAMILKDNKEEVYRGTLVIEEYGEWSFSGFDYQYRGTYLLQGTDDLATGMDKSVIIPVSCRAKGLGEIPNITK